MRTSVAAGVVWIALVSQSSESGIFAVLLPILGVDLKLGPLQSAQLLLSYTLGYALALIALSGRIGPRLDNRWFGIATAISACASLLQALGEGPNLFIFSRFLSGVCGAFLASWAQPILVRLTSGRSVSFGYTLWASALSISVVVGSVSAALLSENFGWRTVLFAQALALVISVIGYIVFFDQIKPPAGLSRVGFVWRRDFILQWLFLSFLTVALSSTALVGRFGSMPLTLLAAVIVLSAASYLIVGKRSGEWWWNWRAFRSENFRSVCLVSFVLNVALGVTFIANSFWLTNIERSSAGFYSLVLSAGAVTSAIVGPIIGRLVPAERVGMVMIAGIFMMMVAFAGMCFWSEDSPNGLMVVTRMALGVGVAMYGLSNLFMLEEISPSDRLSSLALSLYVRTFLSGLFIALGVAAMLLAAQRGVSWTNIHRMVAELSLATTLGATVSLAYSIRLRWFRRIIV